MRANLLALMYGFCVAAVPAVSTAGIRGEALSARAVNNCPDLLENFWAPLACQYNPSGTTNDHELGGGACRGEAWSFWARLSPQGCKRKCVAFRNAACASRNPSLAGSCALDPGQACTNSI